MSKKYLKVLSVATIAAMMTTFAAPAFAANGDFYDNLNKTPYNAMNYRTSATDFNALLAALETRPSDFVFENGGLGYNYDKMLTAITAGTTAGQTVAEAFVAAKADPANAEALPGDEVTVSSVSAINSTQVAVTFNRAPAAADTLTYTFAGTAVAAANVSVTGSVATLTVPAMTDSVDGTTPTYAVVVSNGDTVLSTTNVVWDKNEITNISIVNNDMNKQIGSNFDLQVKLTDEDGAVIANKSVTLQASGAYNAFETAVEKTATTDANGVATFAWTRNNEGNDTFTVFAADKPVVRANGTVVWALADTSLVTVDTKDSVTLGTGTYKDYTVTVKNANNSPRIAATNHLHIALSTAATVYYRDLNVTSDTAANAWVSLGTAAAFDVTNQPNATLANANINANGVMKFRIVDATANDVVTPTFFYNVVGAEASAVMDAQDPRTVGSTITYVAQTPVITFTPANTVNTLATALAPLGTAAEKAANVNKTYTLTAKDQFGNPYRGNVLLADYLNIDNVGLSVPTAAGAQINIDYNSDGTYDATNVALGGANTTFAFAYDSTLIAANADTNNDSVVNVALHDGTNLEAIKLAAFADTNPKGVGAGLDTANQIDADEVSAVADSVSFATRAINSIAVAPVAGTEMANNGQLDYNVTIKDQFGDGVLPGTTLDFEIAQHPSMALETTDGNFVVAASNTTAAATPVYATTALNATTQIVLGTIDNNVVKIRVTGQGAGATAGDWELIAYQDAAGPGGRYDGTQKAGSAVFTVKAATLGGGNLTGNFVAGGVVGATAATSATGVQFVGTSTANTANNASVFTYSLLNQSEGAYTVPAGPGVDVVWTVKNEGSTIAQVWDPVGGAYTTLAAGQTATYTTNVAAAGTFATYRVNANAATDTTQLTVTAQIKDNAASAKVASVKFLPAANQITADTAVANTITGTIVGIQKDGLNDGAGTADNADGTIIIVKNSLGEYYAITLANGNVATVKVSGNTPSTETVLESNISVGQNITISLDGSGVGAFDAADTVTIS